MARAAVGIRRLQSRCDTRAPGRSSKNSAPSAAPLLSRFACFEALRHKFNKPWWEWPEAWRQPDDAKCAELRKGADAAEIEFVEFVQWTADRQLAAAKDRADRLGMKVGLYLDVAVGVQSDGFDAWNEQVAISRHLGVGAPPDPLNTAGQSWGLAGFNATGLEQKSFEPYREMLRASMRHAGAIRLDHVLGLKRLYLVPQGFGAADGVYVQMPFEALLAATAQESVAQPLRRDRRGPRHRAGRISRADRRLGHLVLSGDDVRARGPRPVQGHRSLPGQRARHLQHP